MIFLDLIFGFMFDKSKPKKFTKVEFICLKYINNRDN